MQNLKSTFILLVGILMGYGLHAQCPSPGTYNSNTDLTFGDSPTDEECLVAGSITVPSNKSPDVTLSNSGKFVVGEGDVNTDTRTTIGDLYLGGNSIVTINTTDSLIIWGDFTMDGNGDLDITSGTLYIYGSMTINGNAAFGAGGNVIIKGDFTVTGSNADVSVGGGFSVGGTADLGSEDITIAADAVFKADDLVSSGTLTIEDGGTAYVANAIDDGITVDNQNTGGDADCTNNCCGQYCDGSDNLSPEGEAALPIKLAEFSLIQESNSINIFWSTVSEDNFSHFELYRRDETGFTQVASIASTGDINGDDYCFTDLAPQLGNNVYQLKAVDFDGYEEWFPAKSLLFQPIGVDFKVYPNPGMPIDLKTDIYDKFQLDVFDLSGNRIVHTTVENKDLSSLSILESGNYIFRYTISGHVVNQRVMIR